MKQFVEEFKYLKYTLFHPFDAFFEIKWRGKGSLLLAALIMILNGIASIMSYQYTGFIMNKNPLFKMNSVSLFVLAIAPMFLFIVSNWSVSTLYNGKGKIKDLFMVISYSLFPSLLFSLMTIFLSNFVILEEASLLYAFNTLGLAWFYYLVFCGLCTVHEYTVKENIMTLLATVIAAIVIIFLSVLYFSLMEQMVNFVMTFGQELLRRW